MKITELFNNPKDPIDQILNKDKDKKIDNDEYKFDLGEDLIYFMHHNEAIAKKIYETELGNMKDGKYE